MAKKCIVSSCIIIKGGKTLLLMHKKLGKLMYCGGHVDKNETPAEAAVREAMEETGYHVKILGRKGVDMPKVWYSHEEPGPVAILYEHVFYPKGRHIHFDLIYLAMIVGKRGRIRKGESTELKWFSESEIDGLDTYPNVKGVIHKAFSMSRSFRAEVS